MMTLGISLERNKVKIALLSQLKSHLTIHRLEEYASFPCFDEKKMHIVTGLPSKAILRREIQLKLLRNSSIFKALPFQIESLFSSATEDSFVYPLLFRKKEYTEVVLLGTTQTSLNAHLKELSLWGIDPDQVSCVPMALSKWARWIQPKEKKIAFIHNDTALALDGDKIVAAHFSEERDRLELFLTKKFADYVPLKQEHLISDYSYDTLKQFAVPLGLALEGFERTSCQFRQANFISDKEHARNRSRSSIFFAMALLLLFLVGGIGSLILHLKKRSLERRVEQYTTLLSSSLENTLIQWKKGLAPKYDELSTLAFPVPRVRDVLAWIGGFKEMVDITQFHYHLIDCPKIGEDTITPYRARVSLNFTAKSADAALRFKEALKKSPSLIEEREKIQWELEDECYTFTFYLRKN